MKHFDIDTVVRHFLIAAIWADTPEREHVDCASGSSQRWARENVLKFYMQHQDLCDAAMRAEGYGSHPDAGSPSAAFGHDLYLTMAGHGTGFADRDELGALRAPLHDAARAYGGSVSMSVYVEDGKLYIE